MTKVEQIQAQISTSPTVSGPPEKQPTSPTSPTTFRDILPSHYIISADCSAGTYYDVDQSKFKSVIRRIAEPAADPTPQKEIQKQDEESLKYSFRRSILQKPGVQKYVDGLKKMRPSKIHKDGSGNRTLSRLFNKSPEEKDEENRKDILYDYDSESDEEVHTVEEFKLPL